MHAVALVLLLCLASLVTAKADAPSLAEKAAATTPDVGSLEVDLMVALLRAQNAAASPAHLTSRGISVHGVVREARLAMFEAYDALLAGQKCAGLRSMRRRKAVIEHATVLLNDYLFRAAKIDMHNGCLGNPVDFGSIVYVPRN